MAKKDFSGALAAGVKRDQTLRETTNVSRFERVDVALAGRQHLLDAEQPAAAEPALTGEQTSFYVETLEKEGKVKSTYTAWALDKIDDNPLNSRTIYKEDKIAARAASMARDGQLQPALAARHPEFSDRVILIDGHYRKQGALRNRAGALDLKILDGLQPIDFYRLARAANNEREQETILDVAYGYKKLLDEGYAKSNDELAKLVEEGKSKVSKTLSLLELPPGVLEAISTNAEQFGINVSYELALYYRATDEARTVALAERIRREELSFQKVKAIREAVGKQRSPRKSLSRQYKVSAADGTSIGAMKEWGDGKIQIELTLGSSERAEDYIATLKQMLTDDGHQMK